MRPDAVLNVFLEMWILCSWRLVTLVLTKPPKSLIDLILKTKTKVDVLLEL